MPRKLFVITGPSATGKTFLADKLCQLYPDQFESVKIFTTRTPRLGEKKTDRTFISLDQFENKVVSNEFLIYGEFHGNKYGYAVESLKPKAKHLVVNAWPSFVPKFLELPSVIFAGFRISPNNYALLEERMLKRGDSPNVVKERLEIIKQDSADLEKVSNIISANGHFFEITNDETIPSIVIPWILDQTKSI